MAEVRSVGTAVSSLKNPNYTGENRCFPCTIVNTVIAVALAGVAGATAGGWSVAGIVVGLGTLSGALAVVYLRGYLVPGTPELTKRYLPESVLAVFDKVETEPEGLLDPESELRAIGIVEEDDEVDDLVLTPEFEREWLDAIVERTASEDDLRMGIADLMDLGPDVVDLERRSTSYAASHGDEPIARWESKAACQADVASAAILPRFDARWGNRPLSERLDILGTLRLFLEQCPTCGGAVSLSHEVVESCCRSHDVVATTCDGCTARLFEMRIDTDAFESASSESTTAGAVDGASA